MFREMLRKKQQLSEEECVAILKKEKRGVLSVRGEGDYPYGMPMNHWYCPEDGHIYFHSGCAGHRTDAMRAWDKASFCVYDEGKREEGHWALHIRSVIVFGRIREIEDPEQAIEISRRLSYKFTDDENYIEAEIRSAGHRVLCFELIPEHMTGKLVKES